MLRSATSMVLPLAFALMLWAVPSSAESELSPKSVGISVRFIPDHARPGDVVQLRQSLVFQPKRSGSLLISGATLDVVTSRGRQTVTVPELTLVIDPTKSTDTSNTPVPLPAPKPVRPPRSMAMLAVTVVIGSVLIIVLFLVAQKYRNRQSTTATPATQTSPLDELVSSLQSGQLPRQDLERLLAVVVPGFCGCYRCFASSR